jgi:signal transduction histidine kinase/ActR/RegA family two-component response regulator
MSFFSEQYDYLALIGVVTLGWAWLLLRYAQVRHARLLVMLGGALSMLIAVGGFWLVNHYEQQQRQSVRSMLQGYVPLFARGMETRGHAKLTWETSPDEAHYLLLLQTQEDWIRNLPAVENIYTLRRDPLGQLRYVVDSAAGRAFDGNSESMPLGDPCLELPGMYAALQGETVFDERRAGERWGAIISAYEPLFDDKGNIEGLLGVDFRAAEYLWQLRLARGLPLIVAAILQGVLLLSMAAFLGLMRRAEQQQAHQAELEISNNELLRTQRELETHTAQLTEQNLALTLARHKAEEAVKIKSEFLANMSHELRTPLTAILGYADLLHSALDPAGKERRDENFDPLRAINTVQRNGQHLLELINDVLDFSKLEAHKVSIERTQISAQQIVSEIVSLLRLRARDKGLSLNVQYQNPIPQTIRTDALRLRQILTNLIGNAIKFTERGSVKILVRYAEAANPEPTMIFEVIDTGIGLEAPQLQKLFREFSQIDGTLTRKYGGTGLGLAISKRLAYMLGGDIHVSSTVGKGSRFTLHVAAGRLDHIPLINATCEGETEEVTLAPTSAVIQKQLTGHVLVAEDGPDNQRLISLILGRAGLQVTLVDDGEQAFAKIKECEASGSGIDLVLTDMQMPIMDGYTLARRLRETGYMKPIIALTAHALAGDREKCVAAGCNDYTCKPIHRAQLLEKISVWLGQTQGTNKALAAH